MRCVRETPSVVHPRDEVVVAVGWKLVEHLVMELGACMVGGRMGLLVPNILERLGVFKIGL